MTLKPVFDHKWEEVPAGMVRGLGRVKDMRVMVYRTSDMPDYVFFDAKRFVSVLGLIDDDVVMIAVNDEPLNLYAFKID